MTPVLTSSKASQAGSARPHVISELRNQGQNVPGDSTSRYQSFPQFLSSVRLRRPSAILFGGQTVSHYMVAHACTLQYCHKIGSRNAGGSKIMRYQGMWVTPINSSATNSGRIYMKWARSEARCISGRWLSLTLVLADQSLYVVRIYQVSVILLGGVIINYSDY